MMNVTATLLDRMRDEASHTKGRGHKGQFRAWKLKFQPIKLPRNVLRALSDIRSITHESLRSEAQRSGRSLSDVAEDRVHKCLLARGVRCWQQPLDGKRTSSNNRRSYGSMDELIEVNGQPVFLEVKTTDGDNVTWNDNPPFPGFLYVVITSKLTAVFYGSYEMSEANVRHYLQSLARYELLEDQMRKEAILDHHKYCVESRPFIIQLDKFDSEFSNKAWQHLLSIS